MDLQRLSRDLDGRTEAITIGQAGTNRTNRGQVPFSVEKPALPRCVITAKSQ